MIIRDLTDGDYSAVLKLYEKLDQLHTDARPDCCLNRDCAYPRKDYDECLQDAETLMLGAFENDALLGTVRATLWNESGMIKGVKTVYLDNIYVLPTYRRRGIAKALFAEVENWAKSLGAVRLDLHVWDFNEDAIALYQAMGMGFQRHVMEKKL